MARKILKKIIDLATRIELTLSILMPRPWNLPRNSTIHFYICSYSVYLLRVIGSTLWRSQFHNISSLFTKAQLSSFAIAGVAIKYQVRKILNLYKFISAFVVDCKVNPGFILYSYFVFDFVVLYMLVPNYPSTAHWELNYLSVMYEHF